ncbi:MAG: hypothetical protein PHP26_05485 [Syntrophomonas sp.]|uniref:hypothetical protein n=1 Tax=Syntrophomonas sp. TaxID=2053627 RepID=UPI0026279614|nr:hypothetical protein [Syntrophomonas sp.]MDD2511327.1 hypothetical protein [Syntrophomonas sp.]MDD3879428.1 hypothetical protein [Syntrophomonas sp.]MDD4627445.1 hypothetical protein [Syntrophomonas sp.]
MSKAEAYETPIMSLEEFNVGLLEKDRIPGLLIRSDEQGFYNIGVQINDQEVVKVASAMEDDAMYKIQFWAAKVDQIKDQYKERQPQLK